MFGVYLIPINQLDLMTAHLYDLGERESEHHHHQPPRKKEREREGKRGGCARVGIKFFVNKRRPGHFHYLKTRDKNSELVTLRLIDYECHCSVKASFLFESSKGEVLRNKS